jgi:hypothetical protein
VLVLVNLFARFEGHGEVYPENTFHEKASFVKANVVPIAARCPPCALTAHLCGEVC